MKSIYLEIGEQLKRNAETETNTACIYSNSLKKQDAEGITKTDNLGLTQTATGNDIIKTYSSFSGADVIVYIDNIAYGELEAIYYYSINELLTECISLQSDYIDKNLVSEYPVVIYAKYTIFNKSLIIKPNSTITLKFGNEEGNAGSIDILGVRPISSSSGLSVDSLTLDEEIILCARMVTSFKNNEN